LDGNWSWSGPNGFAATSREVTLSAIQPAQAGVYKVTYTNASGCTSAFQTFTLNITETVTAIQDGEHQRFQLYPNPTTSTIIIPNASELRRVNLLDEQGRLINSVRHKGDSATVSLRDLPAGIYMIELIDHRNATTRSRVVKQ
jgi:hypothetical protein